jgi:hypothetical protein
MDRMRRRSQLLLFALLLSAPAAHATEYVVPAGDVAGFFASLPKDATYISFSAAAEYQCTGDIVLPSRPLLVIDGRGCTLRLGPNSNGFTCAVADQQDAVARLSGRYAIRDFAAIEGGRKAIDLKATLGSSIVNCKLIAQTEAAVDLRFCLMAHLEQVLVTNPRNKGFVLRQGDWPGATAFNSQSNSSVLIQCRVNAMSTTTDAFTILNSGGVRMSECVSEGAACDHDLFLSATTHGDERKPASNTVVKSFTLSNFHVEHTAKVASIHVNMPAKAVVDLSNVYWNNKQMAPVILYVMGQLNLSDIGWWDDGFRIASLISAPRINVERCHSALDVGTAKEATDTKAGVLELFDPIEGNTAIKLTYVRVRDKSM